MSPVLVDANVLIDVLSSDRIWMRWSSEALTRAATESTLVINAIIYAEAAVGMPTVEQLEAALPTTLFKREALPFEAAFLAGKVFLEYRRRGGVRRSPLPDFDIGAHAAVAGYRLRTRDASRYRTYFPRLELIAPS